MCMVDRLLKDVYHYFWCNWVGHNYVAPTPGVHLKVYWALGSWSVGGLGWCFWRLSQNVELARRVYLCVCGGCCNQGLFIRLWSLVDMVSESSSSLSRSTGWLWPIEAAGNVKWVDVEVGGGAESWARISVIHVELFLCSCALAAASVRSLFICHVVSSWRRRFSFYVHWTRDSVVNALVLTRASSTWFSAIAIVAVVVLPPFPPTYSVWLHVI